VSDARQKARDLIELAVDERTPEKERLSAAVKAVALIRKHDLLASPLDMLSGENETVQAAKSILEVLTDPKLTKNVKKVAERFRHRR
jgi:hypothetical protein